MQDEKEEYLYEKKDIGISIAIIAAVIPAFSQLNEEES